MKKTLIKMTKEIILMVVLVVFLGWCATEFWNTLAHYFVPSLADAKVVHGIAFIGLMNVLYYSKDIINIRVDEKETEKNERNN